jgi:hypothetical protein
MHRGAVFRGTLAPALRSPCAEPGHLASRHASRSQLLPKLNSRMVRLLDNARCSNQIAALERCTARGGKDSIDHPSGGLDNAANAVAAAVYLPTSAIQYGAASYDLYSVLAGRPVKLQGLSATGAWLKAVADDSTKLCTSCHGVERY